MRECKKEDISLASLVYKVMWLIVQVRLVKVVEERQRSKVVLDCRMNADLMMDQTHATVHGHCTLGKP